MSLMVVTPIVAFFAAPSAADAGPEAPGANLGGLNSSATATAIQIQPLTPGLVGAGNIALGNLIQASIPYASSTSSTGPTSSGTATPVYPGPTASQLGTVFDTFAPLPPQMVSLLNDPVLAQSTYPAQVSTPGSSSYAPPVASLAGVGTASTTSTEGGTSAQAAVSDFSTPVVEIDSSKASTSSTIGASSLVATAHSDVATISLLGGLVTISGISSDATASSDGTTGKQHHDLRIGSVTVAGQAASIGPDGLQLAGTGQGQLVVDVFNQALDTLKQAGLSVTVLAPTTQVQGSAASVTSGAVDIAFFDNNLPNPNGLSPLHAVGLNIDVGLSQASADATALPPLPPASPSGPAGAAPASGGGSAPYAVAPVTPGSPGNPASFVPGPPGQVETVGGSPGSSAPALAAGSPERGAVPSGLGPVERAGFLGLPVKVSWVVAAFLLSLVAAGPLLAYANWQLLRGRSP